MLTGPLFSAGNRPKMIIFCVVTAIKSNLKNLTDNLPKAIPVQVVSELHYYKSKTIDPSELSKSCPDTTSIYNKPKKTTLNFGMFYPITGNDKINSVKTGAL